MWLTLLIVLYALLFMGCGYVFGYNYREMKDILKYLQKKVEEKPEVGITPGLYAKTNEYNVNGPGATGLVSPKTPQQLAFEESEALKKMNNRAGR